MGIQDDLAKRMEKGTADVAGGPASPTPRRSVAKAKGGFQCMRR